MPTNWQERFEKRMKRPSESLVLTVLGCVAVVVICVCSLGLEYGWFSRFEPVLEEKGEPVASVSSNLQTERYNLNTVTVNELAQLPGVGEELARRIVLFRYQNGGFQSLEQLRLVEGMSEWIFSEILPYITI